MARNEAVILPVNCVSAHKTYYARYDYAYDGVLGSFIWIERGSF